LKNLKNNQKYKKLGKLFESFLEKANLINYNSLNFDIAFENRIAFGVYKNELNFWSFY
jgi:hypothetical protein